MWIIVGMVFAILLGTIYAYQRDDAYSAFMFCMMALGVCTALFIPTIGATSGFVEGYSEGTRDGYVTKLSRKGLFWKTDEGEMQLGAGQQAALQKPFSFSVKDPVVLKSIEDSRGKRVRLTYTQWAIQPFRYGGTTYEVTAVEVLDVD